MRVSEHYMGIDPEGTGVRWYVVFVRPLPKSAGFTVTRVAGPYSADEAGLVALALNGARARRLRSRRKGRK